MKRRISALMVALLTFFGMAHSQQVVLGEIMISQLEVEVSDDSVSVAMLIDLSDVKVKSNRQVTLSPLLVLDADTLPLPEVKVMGRRRYLYSQRNEPPSGPLASTLSVRRHNHTFQQVRYAARKALRHPPRRVQLLLSGRRAGSACTPGTPSAPYLLAEKSPEFIPYVPLLVDVAPAAEVRKERSGCGSSYIDFKTGSATLLPGYRNNAEELEKMARHIYQMMGDEDRVLTRILITSFASPEGPLRDNERLAQRRTQALVSYLQERYHLPGDKFVVGFGSEDWGALRVYVAQSHYRDKEAVLQLIDSPIDTDVKERRLRQHYPEVYLDLKKICFPKLRRSDYVVSFTLRRFTAAEARQLIFTAPQKLSHPEMYAVAQTFPKGSDAYDEVFAIAVRMYPTDEVANLNAANAALRRRDLPAARKYLDRAGESGEALLARGVWHYLSHDSATALQLLHRAQKMGVKEAIYNQNEILRVLHR